MSDEPPITKVQNISYTFDRGYRLYIKLDDLESIMHTVIGQYRGKISEAELAPYITIHDFIATAEKIVNGKIDIDVLDTPPGVAFTISEQTLYK